MAQTRTAKDLLAADLIGQPQLDNIARKVGMSVSRFVRSFREATGLPPLSLAAFIPGRARQGASFHHFSVSGTDCL